MIDYFMIDDHLNCVCSLWVCIKAKKYLLTLTMFPYMNCHLSQPTIATTFPLVCTSVRVGWQGLAGKTDE
jgi:hypothetical protein